ncbi:rare lipoprotein A [Denitrovibrio acetiphilus DSM 12809]|uniref:Probable endolytic peptidoglycan transglycosylase RlpA n=1 Tax=Denitrovibrio acetiphilus (strain DSM 12809 / NBRC 114555 / N2460) TaxID=522772 RepID=D4H1B3_DENA2|nr:septal ring lytic transglycosylase RlpA family protein [Denitrovibrio acetiphilus]ADD66861.1 rare lipoprotein A [Denitrovibrio acetiphilus DSM 12809]
MKTSRLISLCLFFLAACTSTSHSEYSRGTYGYKVPEGAVMSGAVFDRPYTVRGITYYRLKSVKSFNQTGLASWYGRQEHGKLTASGERYNMYAMTAAHKQLPLGSKVLVRCMETNREVIVTINDRGPHVPGRVIDLSYTGAAKLGIVDKGLTKVTLELLNGEETEPADGHFSVQLASFSMKANARELADRFRNSKVVAAYVNGRQYFRVKVTGFASRGAAENYKSRVSGQYPGALVIAED